jgi:hypothetical protein
MYSRGKRCTQGLVGKPEGKIPLGKPRRRWEDNITMALQYVEWERGMDWIDLGQDRGRWWAVVYAVKNLRVTQNEGNFWTS